MSQVPPVVVGCKNMFKLMSISCVVYNSMLQNRTGREVFALIRCVDEESAQYYSDRTKTRICNKLATMIFTTVASFFYIIYELTRD
jgi:hypothetical protein